jgi:hypothetical protein
MFQPQPRPPALFEVHGKANNIVVIFRILRALHKSHLACFSIYIHIQHIYTYIY